MDLRQFGEACKETERLLTRDGTEPSTRLRVPDKPWVRAHLLWMLDQALVFYTEKPEKANRWLGFVQGCMACHGYALDDLKKANMPSGTMFDPDRV